MIVFESVSKTYREGKVRALDGVQLAIADQEVFGLIGPNGAGKTTFLRLLLGLLEPTAGRVVVPEAFRPGSPQVACVLDGEGAYPDITVRDNLRFFGSLYGLAEAEAEARGLKHLAYFGLSGEADRLVGRLSQGQKKIVSLCRAMITEPSLLVVDELTATLDPGNQRRLIEFLREMNAARRATVVFASHALQHVQSLARHVVLIAKGRVRADFPPGSLAGFECRTVPCVGAGGARLCERLRAAGFTAFQEAPGACSVVYQGSGPPGAELARLLEGHGVSAAAARPANLEDLYLAYVGADDGG
jgi:ABC-type multidrug transport system ATPase subunit